MTLILPRRELIRPTRRRFIAGAAALIAMPAIVRATTVPLTGAGKPAGGGGGNPSLTFLGHTGSSSASSNLDLGVTIPGGTTGLVAAVATTGTFTGISVVGLGSFTSDVTGSNVTPDRFMGVWSIFSGFGTGSQTVRAVTASFDYRDMFVWAVANTTALKHSQTKAASGGPPLSNTITTAAHDLMFAICCGDPQMGPTVTFDTSSSEVSVSGPLPSPPPLDSGLGGCASAWSGIVTAGVNAFTIGNDWTPFSVDMGWTAATYG